MEHVRLTFKLEGDTIPFRQFAEAMLAFNDLIATLTEEVSDMPLDWDLAELRKGSALSAMAVYKEEQRFEAEKVDIAYHDVGGAMVAGRAIPFSEKVGEQARKLSRVVRGPVKGISLIPSNNIVHFVNKSLDLAVVSPAEKSHSFGTITGLGGTLSARNGLKLTLYDDLFDKAVYCYLADHQAEIARGLWNKRLQVTGFIYRDPDSGRPIEVKEIADLEFQPVSPEESFYEVRGMFRVQDDPEVHGTPHLIEREDGE